MHFQVSTTRRQFILTKTLGLLPVRATMLQMERALHSMSLSGSLVSPNDVSPSPNGLPASLVSSIDPPTIEIVETIVESKKRDLN